MKNKLQTTRWAVDLSTWPSPTMSQLTQAVAAIQPEERIRLMKFYFINDFLSSLVGRLLMRKFVSQSCNLPYAEIKFARDSRGKPYWQQSEPAIMDESSRKPNISFNVSHHGRYVILAGAVDSENSVNNFGIGCDVMKLEYSGGKDLKEFFRIMQRKFAESEWRYIRQPHFNQHQQIKAFMRHWCLKESYVKELGVGITVDLEKIIFSVDRNKDLTMESQPLCSTTLNCNGIPMNEWLFEEHMLNPKYCAAIAFRNFQPNAVEKFQVLQIDELLQASPLQDDPEIIDYCRQALNKPIK